MSALYDRTDWALLRTQKAALINLLQEFEIDSETRTHLDGILHFIDAIQDDANEAGYPVYSSRLRLVK